MGEGAISLLERARVAAPDELPERIFCVADSAALRENPEVQTAYLGT